MRKLKHLPLDAWPVADHDVFCAAYNTGDIFDGTAGPGAHLAEGTRKAIETAYRRWLGFLQDKYSASLDLPPASRITPDRLRDFIEHIRPEMRTSSVGVNVGNLYHGALLIAPNEDWRWLRKLTTRIQAHTEPIDRFDRLVPTWQLLDLGIELMETPIPLESKSRWEREIRFRDGLILAILSMWPIRRRSIAALTVTGHVELDEAGVTLLLFPHDTKSKRQDSYRLPELLVPYFHQYLHEIRLRLIRGHDHDGLWASLKGGSLTGGSIYATVGKRIKNKFDKAMGLHDIRRSAATFFALGAPEMVGVIPGLLQHSSPEISDKHYNLARSTTASRRHGAMIENLRADLCQPHLSRKD